MYNCGLVVLLWVGKQQKGGKMPFARTFNDHQTAALGLSMHPLCNTVLKTACFRYGTRYFTLAVREKTGYQMISSLSRRSRTRSWMVELPR